ncbi:MAG TPA: UrcA family protein [Woeseiaceae bacterium]|nr:UrcA family protein [Woeseiaceae bacterium]
MTASRSTIGRHFRSGRPVLLALLPAAALALSPMARAELAHETRAMTVSYADLDVSTSAGLELLHARIRTAARTVCGPWERDKRLDLRGAWRECYDGAVSNAVAALEQANVEPAQAGRE